MSEYTLNIYFNFNFTNQEYRKSKGRAENKIHVFWDLLQYILT